ncbi:universal stress protein [Paeniglutamicibacter sp. ABSL32-1]|uniref:universal stress protein n=1 Tax=Paeniglutamicibacter quisquiliarum TaxID=2849498 RepID=UPI001C2D0FB3|nr:universal stress protein [Paeniglutamicibacter quisquiliarum]MBV1778177.1 universal stress protein [Paeniglutamicibacter quisquiliarum]
MREPEESRTLRSAAPVLVGVFPGQHPEVLETAARLASLLRQDLVCAYALTGLDLTEWNVKTRIDFDSLHRDEREELGSVAIEGLRLRLGEVLAAYPVPWKLRILVGEPARALGEYGVELGTSFLVVGSPRRKRFPFAAPRLRASTLIRVLSRRQIPVLVVPPLVLRSPPPAPYLP